MTDEAEHKEDKPLLPRTAAGATIVAIPLASLLGGFGWIGQKVLTLDEEFRSEQARIVALAAQQEKLVGAGVRIEQELVATTTNGQRNEQFLRRVEGHQTDLLQQVAKLEAAQQLDRDNRLQDRAYVDRRLEVIELRMWTEKEEEK